MPLGYVATKEVVPGNIVTFHFKKGYAYHTGIIVSVTKDKDGNITSFKMIHSSGGIGPNIKTVTVGEGKLVKGIAGYFKWDTKPDKVSISNNNSPSDSNIPAKAAVLLKIANDAHAKGLKNAEQLFRNEAQKIINSSH